MTRFLIALAPTIAVAACSAPANEPDRATIAATRSLSSTTAPALPATSPRPTPTPTPVASKVAGSHRFSAADGLVTLDYTDPLTPGHDFGGRALQAAGWRLMWNGKAGPGDGVVSFSEDARPAAGNGYVTEFIQIGMSRDPGVVSSCGTAGMSGGIAKRLPNRMIGGHRWTVWRGGDAGMSQEIDATDYRTVVNGICYAIDRASYYVRAADPKPGLPTQRAAATRIDAVLHSVHVGG